MKKHFGKIFAVLAVAAILILGIMTGKSWEAKKYNKAEMTPAALSAQISELSDLSTAELEYRGLIRYSEGEINFLTKKEFTMIYDAHVKAGVDLSKVQVDMKENKITVSLPAAEIQNINIDPDSLEFYDEKAALFNFQNRVDTVKALQYAEDDINSRTDETDLLTTADEKAKSLITGLLTSTWSDKETKPEITFQTLKSTASN